MGTLAAGADQRGAAGGKRGPQAKGGNGGDSSNPPGPATPGTSAQSPKADVPTNPPNSPVAPSVPQAPAKPGELVIIGTGHVFNLDQAIRDCILALRPDAVFIELDQARMQALLERRRTGAEMAPEGYVARKLQQFQRSVAAEYGAEAGGEMLAALDGARMVGARVYLVDRSIEETQARLKAAFGWKEKLRVAGMVVGGGARALWPFGKKSAKQHVEETMARYQEDPQAVFAELAEKLPAVHKVVIDERDEVLSAGIRRGLAGARLGVAVLGDGHLDGVTRRLADLKPTVYRVADARAGRLPKPLVARSAPGETGKVSFSFVAST